MLKNFYMIGYIYLQQLKIFCRYSIKIPGQNRNGFFHDHKDNQCEEKWD